MSFDPNTFQPTDATPYLVELTTIDPDSSSEDIADRLAGVEPVMTHDIAVMVASLISPYPHLVEPIDVECGHWNVWLPNYMTKTWWEYGVTLELVVGAYRIAIDYDHT